MTYVDLLVIIFKHFFVRVLFCLVLGKLFLICRQLSDKIKFSDLDDLLSQVRPQLIPTYPQFILTLYKRGL